MAIFEFTAIRGDVLSLNPLDVGSAFTMPIGDRTTLVIEDGDTVLAGDLFRNEVGDDIDQILLDDGEGRGGVRIYAERRLFVQDAEGREFTLIEIERQGGGDIPENRFYTFVGPVPNQNAALTIVGETNAIGNVAQFGQLSAGVSFTPNAAGEIIVEAEDLLLNGYITALDGGASGGEVIAVQGANGAASIIFGGETENYTILVDLVDAVNGASEVSLFVNGQLVTSAVLDFANEEGGLQRLTIAAPERVLAEGDLIEIQGVSDGADSAIVDRIVFVENNGPEANPDVATVAEDQDVTISVLANDVDPNGEQLFVVEAGGQPAGETATVVSDGGREGLLDVAQNGELLFRTNGDFEDLAEGETDTIVVDYTIVDESGGLATSTITIQVQGENDAPLADDFFGQTDEDAIFGGQLTGFDIDGDQLTFALDATPTNGVVTVNADGSFTYEPANNFNGEDVFTFEVSDGVDFAIGTATITVLAQNDAPTIDEANSDLSFEFAEEEVGGGGPNNLRSCMYPISLMGGGYGHGYPGWLSATAPGAPVAASAALSNQPVTGVIRFDDPDDGDQHIVEVVDVVSFGDNGAFAGVDLSSLFVVDNIDSATGEIDYTFTANAALIDAANGFGEGEVAEISYTVRVTDDGDPELFDETVIALTLIGVNDAPVAPPAFFNGTEDEVVTGQLVANDAEGDALTFLLATDAEFGVVELAADGSFTYTPEPDFNGVDTFTFTVSDGEETITQFGTIFVDPVNDAPLALGDFVQTDEDNQVGGDVITGASGPDFDIDGDPLTVVEVNGQALNSGATITLASGALLIMNDDGTFVYDPNGQFDATPLGVFAIDVFDYTISDGQLTSQATVDIEILGLNDAPVGVDDAFFVNEDGVLAENLLINDQDVDGGGLEIVSGGDVTLGQPVEVFSNAGRFAVIDVLSTGDITFTPGAGFDDLAEGESDNFSFSYIARDPEGGETAPTTVTITVEGQNDAPFFDPGSVDRFISLFEDDTLNAAGGDGVIRLTNTLDFFDVELSDTHTLTIDDVAVGGDAPAGFDALSALSVIDVSAGLAELEFAIDDAILQTMGDGELAIFTYDLTLTDSAVLDPLSDVTTFSVELFGINDAPVANDLAISGDEDTVIAGTVTGFDVDGDALTFFTLQAPNGVVVMNTDGTFTYTPDENFSGVDVFEFEAQDNFLFDVGSVTVTVNPVNDPPQANDDTAATDQNTAVGANLISGGPGADFDPEFNGLTVTEINGVALVGGTLPDVITLPSGAILTIGADGEYNYDPNGQFDNLAGGNTPQTATDVITYTVSDGQLTDTGQLTVTISGLNDAPTAVDDAFTFTENAVGGGIGVNVLTNDVDPDGQTLEMIDGGGDVLLTETFTISSTGGRDAEFSANASGLVSLNTSVFNDLGAGETDTVSFTYQAQDTDFAASNLATVTFTITGENDPVVGSGDAFVSVSEDNPTATELVTFVDPDVNDDVTLTLINSAANGDQPASFAGLDFSTFLQISDATGGFDLLFDMDPLLTDGLSAGQQAIISYTVEFNDGTASDFAIINFEIDGVNDAPVADDLAVSTDEDVALAGTVTAADVDEADTVVFTVVDDGSNGVAVINSDGTFTYTPDANFAGVDTFTFEADDGQGGLDVGTVTVTVDPINDAPTASGALTAAQFDTNNSLENTATGGVGLNSQFTVEMWITPNNVGALATIYSEDQAGVDTTGALNINLLANGGIEFEVNNVDALQTAGGLLTNGEPAHVSVTHDSAAAPGSDNTFIYVNGVEVASGEVASPTASTNVLVGRRGIGDNFNGEIGELRLFDVALSGGDVQDGFDNQALVGDAGLVHYFAFNEADGDAFDLTGNGLTLTAEGDGVLRTRMDAPISVNRLAVQEDAGPATISILVDDVDSGGGDVDVILTASTGVITINNQTTTVVDTNNGTGQVSLVGSVAEINAILALLEYQADANFSGSATLQVDILDQGNSGAGGQLTATDTILIEVLPVNDAPVADNQALTTNEDTVLNGTLTAVDIDGDALTFTLQTEGANGTTVINPDGTFTYTPDENFNGGDQVFFTVDDGNGGSDLGFFTVTVEPQNDTPEVIGLNALRFDGAAATTQMVTFADAPALDTTGEFTVEAVISTTDTSASANRVFSKPAGGLQTFSISVENGEFLFRVNAATTGADVNGGFVADGAVHTLSATVASDGTVLLFVDGVQTGSGTIAGAVEQGNEGFTVGAFSQNFLGEDFTGDVHEVRFFDDLRAPAEINSGFNQVLDPEAEDNLQLYARFEGNLIDSSQNGFVGTVQGTPEFVDGGAPASGQLVTREDTPLELNNIRFEDVEIDFGNDPDQVSLTIEVRDGTLNFAAIGLVDSIDAGANNSDSISVTISAAAAETFVNSATYTPDADFNGVDQFFVTINDQNVGGGNVGPRSDTLQQQIIVVGVNDAPLADDLAVSGDEDTAITGTVTAVEPDGDALTFSLDSDGLNGTAVVNSDGTFTYTPNADFNGVDTFTFLVDDGNGGDDIGLVTVTVDPVNDAPVVTHSSAGFFSGAVADFALIDTFNDFPTSTLTMSAFIRVDTPNAINHVFSYATAAGGDNDLIVRINADSTISFFGDTIAAGVVSNPTNLLDGNFHHIAVVFDGVAGSMAIFVDGVSAGESQVTALPPGSTLIGGGTLVLGHDQDSLGGGFDASQSLIGDIADVVILNEVADAATITDLGQGIVDLSDPNTILVGQFDEPAGAFVDATGNGNDITVNGVIPRVAGPDGITITVLEDETVGVSVGVVDVDVADGADQLEVTVSVTEGVFDFGGLGTVTVTAGADGSKDVTFNGATVDVLALLDSFTYIPANDFNGTDTIEITVSDLGNTGAGGALTTALNIPVIVAPANDSPLADDQSVSGDEDNVITGTVTAVDIDGDALIFSLDSDALDGSVVVNSDGTFTYTPNDDFNGFDSFTFFVEDGQGGDDIGFVDITVNPVNDAPIARDDFFNVDEDAVLNDNVFLDNGNGEDIDPEADPIVVSAVEGQAADVGVQVTLASGALLTLNSDGTFTYDQNGAFNDNPAGGSVIDTFTYEISDGALTDTATVTIDVFGLNDAPIGVDDAFTADENAVGETVNILANDSDPDLDAIFVREGGGDVALTETFTILSGGGRSADFDLDAAGDLTINTNGNFDDLDVGETDTLTFTYEVEDSQGDVDLATIVYTIEGRNDAPEFNFPPGQDEITNEDNEPTFIDTAVGASDPENDVLTFSIVAVGSDNPNRVVTASVDAATGLVEFAPDGQFEDLAVGESELVTIEVQVADGNVISGAAAGATTVPNAGFFFILDFDTGLASSVARGGGINTAADLNVLNGAVLTINPNNTEWTATVSTFLEGAETLGDANDFELLNYGGGVDRIGDQLTVFDATSNATLVYRAPNVATEDGEQVIQFTATGIDFNDVAPGDLDLDAVNVDLLAADIETFGVIVEGRNDAPTANDDVATTDEDTAVVIDLLGNDVDPDASDVLVINGAITPDNGSVIDNGDGTITYTPNAGFFGTDIFTYDIIDGNGGADTGTVTVTVNEDVIAPIELTAVQADGDARGFLVDGEASDSRAGQSISNAGDVNGDGLDDFIVGAPFADQAGADDGVSYVVFGKLGGTSLDFADLEAGVGGFAINGGDAGDFSGITVAGGGDINGDGLADLIIGATEDDNNASGAGSVFVVFGKAGTAAVDLTNVQAGTGGFVIDGVTLNQAVGADIESAGDFNGDGFDDIVIGAYRNSVDFNTVGEAYIVFGKDNGFAVDLSDVEQFGAGGIFVTGVSNGDHVGRAVGGGGDVNGDGFDDVVFGADGDDPNGSSSGAAFVIFGQDANTNTVDLTQVRAGTGADGFVLEGEAANDRAGIQVTVAGDINGDGLDDVLVSASVADPGGVTQAGVTYVVFGKVGNAAIDLSDVGGVVGGFRIEGEIFGAQVGREAAGVGDVNGDGLEDFIIAAEDDGGNSDAGVAYVVFGKTDNSTILASDLEGGNGGFVIRGVDVGDNLGEAISGGDINGDGFADLILGAPTADGPGSNAGAAYVVFGGEVIGVSEATVVGTAAGEALVGGLGEDTIVAAQGDDTITGAEGNDLLIGAAGNDTFVFANGSGDDIVADFNQGADDDILDISDFGFADLAAVQAAMTDQGANVLLQLDADDSILFRDINEDDFVAGDFIF